eukprot:TRINITY_DN4515_c0_g1_i1.p1 TRINITY_DN4515_c0_g1~~TRINITY_DN4515_c0_g1_i1.p1  ORF type:complete len:186 (-),score=69.30 TRINITY_DN4515_c0_g1_i1:249-806(-)
MSGGSSGASSRSSSPGGNGGEEKENGPSNPPSSTLKKQIQYIEKQVEKSLRESNINPATRAKFISICSKFERTSPTRSSLSGEGGVLSKAKFFAESPEERERREKDLQDRRHRFRATKSSFELYTNEEEGNAAEGSSGVLQSVFHRKDSEKRLVAEMERVRLEEEAKVEQKKAFAQKVSMFGKVA